ncbi:MAG: glutamine-hydrolyzing carbamoyl-phosphate synthase small subunit [Candidatus Methanomethylophilaceae archaeon]|nr:glutamine-hydrolyzing carbamoyl-phosphate synthase small subunit [Candidatus Methanomethylophilaceae archaeon]
MTGGYLVLEDGTVFEGELFGANIEKAGEVVFSTGGVDGYQESITDPSSKGQIIVFTYPLVGNYGVSDEFNASDKVHANGIVIKELTTEPSPYYRGKLLGDFMEEKGAVGLTGVDTRALTLKIRECGKMKGKIVKNHADIGKVVAELKKTEIDSSIVDVSPKKKEKINNGKDVTVAVIDCGTRSGLYDVLAKNFNVIKFPYNAKAGEILDSGAKGVIISSGPGNPNASELADTIKTVKELASQMPIMGIALGCDILALAFGAEVLPMKVGHHGCNQPVKLKGRICMTAQSQDFYIEPKSAEKAGLTVTQTNLNDNIIEGFKHSKFEAYGYEYHPEGSPGPDDTVFLFDDFLNVIKGASQ